jgi:hypothetical protein
MNLLISNIYIMSYIIRKVRNQPYYIVKDAMGQLHSNHATRAEANKQVKILMGMMGGLKPPRAITREQMNEILDREIQNVEQRTRDIAREREIAEAYALAEETRRRVREMEQAEEDRMIRNAIRNAKIAKEIQLSKKKKGWFGLGKATGKMRVGMGLTKKQTEEFIKASYAKKKDVNEVNGYFLDKSLSSKKNKVYVNPEGKVVVANAGTSNMSDWLNNAYVPMGLYHTTNRYKDAEKIQKDVINKYGKENITNVGHSQSGELLRNLADRGLTNEAVALNPYIIGKKHEGVDVIRSSGDLVSLMTPNVKETIPAKTWNPYIEHMPNVLGRGKGGNFGQVLGQIFTGKKRRNL